MSDQTTPQNDEISVEELESVAGGGALADEDISTNNGCPTTNYGCS